MSGNIGARRRLMIDIPQPRFVAQEFLWGSAAPCLALRAGGSDPHLFRLRVTAKEKGLLALLAYSAGAGGCRGLRRRGLAATRTSIGVRAGG